MHAGKYPALEVLDPAEEHRSFTLGRARVSPVGHEHTIAMTVVWQGACLPPQGGCSDLQRLLQDDLPQIRLNLSRPGNAKSAQEEIKPDQIKLDQNKIAVIKVSKYLFKLAGHSWGDGR